MGNLSIIEFLVLFLLITLVAIPVTLFVKFLRKFDEYIPRLRSTHFAQVILRISKEEPSRWKVILFASYITSLGLIYLTAALATKWEHLTFLPFVFIVVTFILIWVGYVT